MADSPSHHTGNSSPSPPTNQHGGINAQTLRDLVQTEEGAAILAEALKDRRVRHVLKQHGIKIQTNEDVGYQSLPFELRDKIQTYTIAVLKPDRPFPDFKCTLCPRLAPYACIDSEWRDAVESITFESLDLDERGEGGVLKELEQFECYVVGNRRKYLHYIRLSAGSILGLTGDTEASSYLGKARSDASNIPIHRILNCIKQWPDNGTCNGKLSVEIDSIPWDADTSTMDRIRAALYDLPTVPQITHLHIPLWLRFNSKSMLSLVSRMPNLESAIIVLENTPLPAFEKSWDIHLLFENLSRPAPKLGSLEIKYNNSKPQHNLHTKICTAALSFSQKLFKFCLSTEPTRIGSPTFNTILAPFSTSSFRHDAPPPLFWPNLTHFKIAKWQVIGDSGARPSIARELNEIMSMIGRMVRCMPRIRNLEILVTYGRVRDGCTKIVFSLESCKEVHRHSPQATLSVTHSSDDEEIVENVPSEGVRDLWKESLLCVTCASLEIQVISRGSGNAIWEKLGLVP